mmetsp:Transcript_17923/g.33998  ORF Transcript_17923/g.33998 Transcript_17923/m.33998 type:complete len:318 (-) Transcript_17923:86-1039(-)
MDEALLYRAKLAEQAHRFLEMMTFMRTYAEQKSEALNREERNLFGIACKNVLSARRVSWRVVITEETRISQILKTPGEEERKDKERTKLEALLKECRSYRASIEKEITGICLSIAATVSKYILPKADERIQPLDANVEGLARKSYKDVKGLEDTLSRYLQGAEASNVFQRVLDAESVVFFYKMKGDIYRYLAETAGEHRSETEVDANMALGWYFTATEVANMHLSPADPIRLGLALNFSVFYHQIMSSPKRACEVAKNAFDAAVLDMPTRGTQKFADSRLIMGVLRDNLTTWTSERTDATDVVPHAQPVGTNVETKS